MRRLTIDIINADAGADVDADADADEDEDVQQMMRMQIQVLQSSHSTLLANIQPSSCRVEC